MFWVEILPASVFLAALFIIPESPRFLVLTRRFDEALEVLKKLSGEAVARAKVDQIDASLAADHHKPKMRDLLDPATNQIRKLVWVGIGLATFQQLVGINVVFYHGAVLWQCAPGEHRAWRCIWLLYGVCSPVDFLRYENGARNPRHRT